MIKLIYSAGAAATLAVVLLASPSSAAQIGVPAIHGKNAIESNAVEQVRYDGGDYRWRHEERSRWWWRHRYNDDDRGWRWWRHRNDRWSDRGDYRDRDWRGRGERRWNRY